MSALFRVALAPDKPMARPSTPIAETPALFDPPAPVVDERRRRDVAAQLARDVIRRDDRRSNERVDRLLALIDALADVGAAATSRQLADLVDQALEDVRYDLGILRRARLTQVDPGRANLHRLTFRLVDRD